MAAISYFSLLLSILVVVPTLCVTPMNFLWIMSDDLGVGEVSWYPGRTNTNITTPNVDALSESGMSFLNAYTGSPVCAPSRGTLMTGLHTGHATIRGNHPSQGRDLPLAPIDKTFLEVLKANGYHVSCVGKWGMGWEGTTGDPILKGCTDYFGVLDQSYAHNMYPSLPDFTLRYPASNGSQVWETQPYASNANASRITCMAADTACIWTHDLWTKAALQALTAAKARGAVPFFLYLAYTDPHAGGWGGEIEAGNPVPSDGDFAKESSWPVVERDHASVIQNYQDRDVGALVGALESLGLRGSTAVIFASDNGASNEGGHDYEFFGSSGPLRGFKRCLTEGGIRTPLVASLPGTIPAGILSSVPNTFYDWGDTILDLAGIPVSQWLGKDGVSLKEVLLSPTGEVPPTSPPRPPAYWEFCTDVHPPLEPRSGVGWGHAARNSTWKIVSFFEDQEPRLYDLDNDVYEVNDLAAEHPDIVASLSAWAKAQHVDSEIFPVKNCVPS